jgi:hypothetical protein
VHVSKSEGGAGEGNSSFVSAKSREYMASPEPVILMRPIGEE